MLWLVAGTAFAQTVHIGADLGGADLYLADGDTLEGVFTNVGKLTVPKGATVLVGPEVPLEIHATTVEIRGVLDGMAAGYASGGGGAVGARPGNAGTGPGKGTGGLEGPCVHGGGGGGAGYGGRGGDGAYFFNTGQGEGGGGYGDETSITEVYMGSGGGGGGSGCDAVGANGGRGGASIVIQAVEVLVDGEIHADGAPGNDALTYSGGGGGGSGGTVLIDAAVVDGTGVVSARGGRGGDTVQGIGGLAGGGGGGGGGRIKIFYGSLDPYLTFDVSGGQKGDDQAGGYALNATNGQPGTVYTELTDPDVDDDGIEIPLDNCPGDPNPDQTDTDGDGIGDACDPCPVDPIDSDGDGVCDSVDQCPEGDDNLDTDGDTHPDACDCAPDEDYAWTNADEVCDGFDNNCDFLVDEDAIDTIAWSIDLDGDGFGDPKWIRSSCEAPLNYVDNSDDCDDDRPDVFPGGREVCDDVDNDCDGITDPACVSDSRSIVTTGCGCAQPVNPAGALALGALVPLVLLGRRRR